MADAIKHECGIALVRLLKPLSYYKTKYGTWRYGLDKLYLLMEKQHNRGQEGAGLAAVKLNPYPGSEFVFRERSLGSGAISDVFGSVHNALNQFPSDKLEDVDFAKKNVPYAGELLLGHLSYRDRKSVV